MAFQTPVSLQGVASVTREIWPSFSAAIRTPWRSLTSQQPSSSHAEATRPTSEAHEPTTTNNVSHVSKRMFKGSVVWGLIFAGCCPRTHGLCPEISFAIPGDASGPGTCTNSGWHLLSSLFNSLPVHEPSPLL
ncbi:hypothetical protein BC567DRAFT_46586 [Phyllosticta citribraziliensis]